MWIKALFYMNVGEGPQDVCGWRKCCTTCSSLEFEHWWRVNPPVFVFLFMNCDLCPMNETCWFVFFVLRWDNFFLSFLYFSSASIGQIVFMIWWNISTWKCETAEPQAVWMFVSFFVFFFCSALNFCHQCLSFVFCFRLYSFWFLFVLAFFVPWLFCKSVILPMIKFRLWVVPAHTELCRSNVVFSLCSSSYTYLNMSSMCVHFGGFLFVCLFC